MWEQSIWVGLGGFFGCNARYWLGGWMAQRFPEFPIGTLFINVSGSFVLGLFMTLALYFPWDTRWRLGFAIGFLGGYTTFSTYEYESFRLMEQGSYIAAITNLLGSLLLGFLAAWLGFVVGRIFTRGA